uniref:Uncharacterized protein n=1 Tax=Tanacetum cinerariifolium TaxID=118510 RepID=A0A6L2NES7_TANCI|nr:hypothetical protein [Tanacetum cinerariifolium]
MVKGFSFGEEEILYLFGRARNQEFHKLRRRGGDQSATHSPTTAAAAAGSGCCRCSGAGGVGVDEWWGYGGSEWSWWRVQRGEGGDGVAE